MKNKKIIKSSYEELIEDLKQKEILEQEYE